MESLKEQLIRHEGLRLTVYDCPAGYKTIGVGRNIEQKGITESEALYLLDNDIGYFTEQLEDNLIGGNTGHGISLFGDTDKNKFIKNHIGLTQELNRPFTSPEAPVAINLTIAITKDNPVGNAKSGIFIEQNEETHTPIESKKSSNGLEQPIVDSYNQSSFAR